MEIRTTKEIINNEYKLNLEDKWVSVRSLLLDIKELDDIDFTSDFILDKIIERLQVVLRWRYLD